MWACVSGHCPLDEDVVSSQVESMRFIILFIHGIYVQTREWSEREEWERGSPPRYVRK